MPKVAAAVKAQITTLKRQNPHFGVKRIAQLLRRVLFLPGSAETVRRTLHQEQLIHPRKKKPRTQPAQAAVLRAGDAQSDVADGHLHVSAGEQERLPDRVHRRPLALHRRAGSVSQPDRRARIGGLSHRRGRVRRAQGDADRQRAAVRHLARQDAVRARTGERSGPPHPQPAASPDDAGQDRAVLENDLGELPGTGAVRQLRAGPRTREVVGEVLQPQTSAPVAGGAVSGRSVLRHREGIASRDRARHRRQRPGAGVTRPTPRALLHGRASRPAIGRAARRERPDQDADRRRRRTSEPTQLSTQPAHRRTTP